MPEDSASNIRTIDRLLDELLDLDAPARLRRLAELRDTDAALAAAVERLLSLCLEESGELAPGGALEGSLARECLFGVETQPLAAGTRVGPYLVERLIGRGGMSEVYLASRRFDGFSQQVALKVVRSDRVGLTLRERLLAEQRTLVRLDHPNIARFLDAGVDAEGNVYLAMEAIDGGSILEEAADRKLDLRERVGWTIHLCSALEHAHAQLVVHCDIKPSNVLVDRWGQPRLLDFGIAQALGEAEADATSPGIKLFTPDCAAPEQLSGAAVSTATDVFQIGALLYQLIVGRPWPVDGNITSITRVDSILHEPAVAPSRRLVEARDDPRVRDNAVSCGAADAEALARQVRGGLDAIVLKCLAKSPADRYASIEQLRGDLEAWRSLRPVAAAHAGRWERTRLWWRRNRGVASVAVVGMAALSIVAAMALVRIAEERAQKAREQERALAVEGFMGQVFKQASPYLRGEQEHALETLVRVGDSMLAGSRDVDPRTRLALMAVLANLELDMGQPQLAATRAREALRAADAGQVDDPRTLLAMSALLADALSQQDRDQEAIQVLGPALERTRDADLPLVERAQAWSQLGELYETVGRLPEATRQFDAVFEALVASDAPLESGSIDALRRLGRYLDIGQRGEDPQRVRAIVRRLESPVQGETAIQRAARLSTLSLVGSLAADDPAASGRYGKEAAQALASALGESHPRVSVAWGDACVAFISGGDLLEAKAACEASLAGNVEAGRGSTASAAADRINLATIEYLRGNFASAGRLAREAMAAVDRESALSLYLFGAGTLARIDYREGDQDAALARLDELATIQRQRYPDNADMRLTVHTNRAEVLLAQGRVDAAAAALEEAGVRAHTGGPLDRLIAGQVLAAAAVDAAAGRRDDALAKVVDGIRAFESHPAVSPAELAWALLDGGEALILAGERDPAADLFARALGTGLDPERMPGLWAWASLRLEQLRPGSVEPRALGRAVAVGRDQLGSAQRSVPCLQAPADLSAGPAKAAARTACL